MYIEDMCRMTSEKARNWFGFGCRPERCIMYIQGMYWLASENADLIGSGSREKKDSPCMVGWSVESVGTSKSSRNWPRMGSIEFTLCEHIRAHSLLFFNNAVAAKHTWKTGCNFAFDQRTDLRRKMKRKVHAETLQVGDQERQCHWLRESAREGVGAVLLYV